MLETIKEIDLALLLVINASGGPTIDQIMIWLSDKYIWIPLYAYLIFTLYQKYKWQFWLPLAAVLLTFGFADQFTATFMKPYFERPRPCRDEEISHLVTIVKRCGGKYGFASSHAANTMGLAFIYFLILEEKKWLTISLIIWSFWVGYSRIYLGVHYPGDVIVGFVVGIIGAVGSYQLFQFCYRKLNHVSTS